MTTSGETWTWQAVCTLDPHAVAPEGGASALGDGLGVGSGSGDSEGVGAAGDGEGVSVGSGVGVVVIGDRRLLDNAHQALPQLG